LEKQKKKQRHPVRLCLLLLLFNPKSAME